MQAAPEGEILEDEVQQFIDVRYVGSIEACWRIFRFGMHKEWPNVVRLAVHLPNEQVCSHPLMRSYAFNIEQHLYMYRQILLQNSGLHPILCMLQGVIFREGEDLAAVLERQRNTTLLAFFELNRQDPNARTKLYHDIPSTYTLDNRTRKFHPRRRDDHPVGRMYHVNPAQGEVFYLRLLLTQVAGPTSHEDLYYFEVRIICSITFLSIATTLPIVMTCSLLHADVAIEKGLLIE